jgi:hypothetical protein
MRVDFAQVRLIPFLSVLSTYKVEVRKRSNTEFVAQCPLPSHPADSKHEWTLAISTEKNKAYCHNTRCREAGNKPKGLDSIDFVCMVENTTALEAAKRLSELFALSKGGEGGAANGSIAPKAESATGNQPLAFALRKLDPDHPFIRERGISLETAMEFGIGFQASGSMANRICFPLMERGALIGYAGRTIDAVGTDNPKWKLPMGLVKSFLYGLEKCDPGKPLYLVESPWACLWLFQHGAQAAALLGSSMTEAQENLLAPYADIRIAMDNDDAGRSAADKIYERLKANHRVTKAFLRS